MQQTSSGVDTKVSEALARRASTGHVLLALRSWPLALIIVKLHILNYRSFVLICCLLLAVMLLVFQCKWVPGPTCGHSNRNQKIRMVPQ